MIVQIFMPAYAFFVSLVFGYFVAWVGSVRSIGRAATEHHVSPLGRACPLASACVGKHAKMMHSKCTASNIPRKKREKSRQTSKVVTRRLRLFGMAVAKVCFACDRFAKRRSTCTNLTSTTA